MASLERRWVLIDPNVVVPTVDTLTALMERFFSWGINGFLFPLGCIFPFKAARQSIRSDCYSEEQWKNIYDFCKERGIEFIPHLQTFGHMEWILWHDDFAHLRAVNVEDHGLAEGSHAFYQMEPCNEEGIALVKELIGEVISLFGELNYFHIGGDETAFVSDDPGKTYLTYILPIMEMLISKGIGPLIWSDMVLNYFEIIKDIPDEVIFADWYYGKRCQVSREPDKPKMWGETGIPLAELTDRRKKEFWDHLYRGLEPGGDKHRMFPYPSYFKSKGKKCMVVPAAQCHQDAFTHPTLYWKFDNARAYCLEGHENDVFGAINSDWIVRRVPRELTMICHFGFALIASNIDDPPSNKDIIRAYWESIKEGSGDKAVELFHRIGEARGYFYNETKPIKHRHDSADEEIASLKWRVQNPRYRPGDLAGNDELVVLNKSLVEAGKDIASFCGSLVPGLEGCRKAEAVGWMLSGWEISFRARIWLLIRAHQKRENVSSEAKTLIKETERLESEFTTAWMDRYLEPDIEAEIAYRFRDVKEYLRSILTAEDAGNGGTGTAV